MSAEHDRLKSLLEGASPEQENIICSSGPVCVQACPGSGKTWTASRMFVNRAHNRCDKNRGVVLLSYTRTAVSVFKERISELDSINALDSPNYIGTFDAFIDKFIISQFYYLFNGLQVRPLLGDWDDGFWCSALKRNIRYDDVRCLWKDGEFIFEVKNGFAWKRASSDECEQNVRGFITKCGKYTHSLRRYLAIKILENKKLAACLGNRFEDIIVDEAQDLQPCAFHILNLLRKHAEREVKISLIGDINQSIYKFSGVSTDVYKNYILDWKLKNMYLSSTRRCSTAIVGCINRVFGTNMISLAGAVGKGVFYLDSEQYSKLEVAQVLGVKETEICELKKNREDVNLPPFLHHMVMVCRERDECRNPSSAYKKLTKVISAKSKYALPERDPIPEIWRMIRSRQLLPSLDNNLDRWLQITKSSLNLISDKLDLEMNLNWLKRPNGLLADAPFGEQLRLSDTRTIHSSKGETHTAIVVQGSVRFWNNVVSALEQDAKTEERRILYVAMTRARLAVVLVLPRDHMKKHGQFWNKVMKPLMPLDSPFGGHDGQMMFNF